MSNSISDMANDGMRPDNFLDSYLNTDDIIRVNRNGQNSLNLGRGTVDEHTQIEKSLPQLDF